MHIWPINNRGLRCLGHSYAKFYSKYAVGFHAWIQATVDLNFHLRLIEPKDVKPVNTEAWLYYTVLYKIFEHGRFPYIPWILREDCIFINHNISHVWAQVEFILITQESLEGELLGWFSKQGPLVAANPSIIGYRLPQRKYYPPPLAPTTWKHSFYKPKAVLSQASALSLQQPTMLGAMGLEHQLYKADLGRDPRASLQSLTRCCFFHQLHHIFYLYCLSHLLKSISIFLILLFKAIYPFLLFYRLVF